MKNPQPSGWERLLTVVGLGARRKDGETKPKVDSVWQQAQAHPRREQVIEQVVAERMASIQRGEPVPEDVANVDLQRILELLGLEELNDGHRG